jgi:hypothetical protein
MTGRVRLPGALLRFDHEDPPGFAAVFERAPNSADRPDNPGTRLHIETAIPLVAASAAQGYDLTAELYSLQSGVYAGCPDSAYRDAQRAIATARRAVELDPSRPTLLSILAAAHASAGDFANAVAVQRQALASTRFPSAYRQDGERQLEQYERALAAKRR